MYIVQVEITRFTHTRTHTHAHSQSESESESVYLAFHCKSQCKWLFSLRCSDTHTHIRTSQTAHFMNKNAKRYAFYRSYIYRFNCVSPTFRSRTRLRTLTRMSRIDSRIQGWSVDSSRTELVLVRKNCSLLMKTKILKHRLRFILKRILKHIYYSLFFENHIAIKNKNTIYKNTHTLKFNIFLIYLNLDWNH